MQSTAGNNMATSKQTHNLCATKWAPSSINLYTEDYRYDTAPYNAVLFQCFHSISLETTNRHYSLLSQLPTSQPLYYALKTTTE